MAFGFVVVVKIRLVCSRIVTDSTEKPLAGYVTGKLSLVGGEFPCRFVALSSFLQGREVFRR